MEAILSLNTLPPLQLACSSLPKSPELGEPLYLWLPHLLYPQFLPLPWWGLEWGHRFLPWSWYLPLFSVALPALLHDSCVYVFVEADD